MTSGKPTTSETAVRSFAVSYVFFFFNDTATTEIYTLSLHDALPILPPWMMGCSISRRSVILVLMSWFSRSEEHTSELQSRQYLVCRLLLEKKKSLLVSGTPIACNIPRFSPAIPSRRGVDPHT